MATRIGQYVLVIFVIILLNFALSRMMPGDPTQSMTGTNLDAPSELDEETRARLLEYHGLDKPLPRQFLTYLGNLARLDLGYAIYYKCQVLALIAERLPWTILLAGTSFVLSALAGVVLGTVAAYRQGTRLDRGLVASLLGVRAMPAYLVGMLAILIFSARLKLFPLGGATAPFARYASAWGTAADILWHLALPALVLSMGQTATVFLLARNSTVPVLGEPYMTVAEAKGLSWSRKVFRYGMRNAILPVYTRLGMQLGFLVTGTIFIENVFHYPGMGRLIYEAALVHDYPVLEGIFLVTTLSIVGANLFVDCTYRLVDPRVRGAHEQS